VDKDLVQEVPRQTDIWNSTQKQLQALQRHPRRLAQLSRRRLTHSQEGRSSPADSQEAIACKEELRAHNPEPQAVSLSEKGLHLSF